VIRGLCSTPADLEGLFVCLFFRRIVLLLTVEGREYVAYERGNV